MRHHHWLVWEKMLYKREQIATFTFHTSETHKPFFLWQKGNLNICRSHIKWLPVPSPLICLREMPYKRPTIHLALWNPSHTWRPVIAKRTRIPPVKFLLFIRAHLQVKFTAGIKTFTPSLVATKPNIFLKKQYFKVFVCFLHGYIAEHLVSTVHVCFSDFLLWQKIITCMVHIQTQNPFGHVEKSFEFHVAL